MTLKKLTLICLISLAIDSFAQDIPKLVRNNNGAVHLLVKGKPFIMLGGELMNSSGSTVEDMAPRWKTLKKLNLNTVIVAVPWQQVEQVEGKFDFTVLDGVIKQARQHDMKLVLLWFGSWKNGSSGYAPEWVMRDTKRFPRMQTAKGENRPYVSNFSDEANKADMKAFVALMNFVKKVDSKENTVIMVQIENEVGVKGDSRDRSALADKLFNSEVPAKLLTYVKEKEKQLWPEIAEKWNANGRRTVGTWPQVFGNNNLADELFMAWYYSTYINKIAVAGKQAYPLPMYVNAWTIDPANPIPGAYPSGGPNHRALDVWQANAPDIDVFAVDNYRKDYKTTAKNYYRNGNPMMVPEAVPLWEGDKISGPSLAFYTIGEFNTLCFAPFAIDHPAYDENHPIGKAYAVLNNLMPLLIKEQRTGNMRGILQQDSTQERIDFKDFYMNVRFDNTFKGFGLAIQLPDNEFLVAGSGMFIQFFSKVKGLTGLSYGLIKEGHLEGDKWVTTRYLGGDEAGQGVSGLKFPATFTKEEASPGTISVIKVKLLPIESATTERSDAVN
jgi:hypothetical protein